MYSVCCTAIKECVCSTRAGRPSDFASACSIEEIETLPQSLQLLLVNCTIDQVNQASRQVQGAHARAHTPRVTQAWREVEGDNVTQAPSAHDTRARTRHTRTIKRANPHSDTRNTLHVRACMHINTYTHTIKLADQHSTHTLSIGRRPRVPLARGRSQPTRRCPFTALALT